MHRVFYRRPGCILLVVFIVVATMLAPLPASLIGLVSNNVHTPAYLASAAVIFWGELRLNRRLTQRKVPICPHCGAQTDPAFRICRSCQRVK